MRVLGLLLEFICEPVHLSQTPREVPRKGWGVSWWPQKGLWCALSPTPAAGPLEDEGRKLHQPLLGGSVHLCGALRDEGCLWPWGVLSGSWRAEWQPRGPGFLAHTPTGTSDHGPSWMMGLLWDGSVGQVVYADVWRREEHGLVGRG